MYLHNKVAVLQQECSNLKIPYTKKYIFFFFLIEQCIYAYSTSTSIYSTPCFYRVHKMISKFGNKQS